MGKFEVGKTYTTRSICDYDCIYSIEVIARTAKMVTFVERNETKKCRVFSNYYGHESIRPHGRYSMAAIITAEVAA